MKTEKGRKLRNFEFYSMILQMYGIPLCFIIFSLFLWSKFPNLDIIIFIGLSFLSLISFFTLKRIFQSSINSYKQNMESELDIKIGKDSIVTLFPIILIWLLMTIVIYLLI